MRQWTSVDGVLPLIALQQTECQTALSRLAVWDRLRLRPLYIRNVLPRVESRNRDLLPRYSAAMRGAARELADSATFSSVLDVGGGVGGLGIALHEILGEQLRYVLLDRTGIESKVWYGLREEGARYNDLDVARRFCAANGLVQIRTVDIDHEPFPEGPFDLIVSLLSWGFHYGISTYADEARHSLARDGSVVLDVRDARDTGDELRNAFPGWSASEISSGQKHRRLRIVAPPASVPQ